MGKSETRFEKEERKIVANIFVCLSLNLRNVQVAMHAACTLRRFHNLSAQEVRGLGVFLY
jgi:hypothetical protein